MGRDHVGAAAMCQHVDGLLAFARTLGSFEVEQPRGHTYNNCRAIPQGPRPTLKLTNKQKKETNPEPRSGLPIPRPLHNAGSHPYTAVLNIPG